MSEYSLAAFTPENVKAFRISQGMTQKEFADKIGVSQATVSKAENNIKDLRVSYLVKMQQAFDISTSNVKMIDIPLLKRWWLRIRWFLGLYGESNVTGAKPVTYHTFVVMVLNGEL